MIRCLRVEDFESLVLFVPSVALVRRDYVAVQDGPLVIEPKVSPVELHPALADNGATVLIIASRCRLVGHRSQITTWVLHIDVTSFVKLHILHLGHELVDARAPVLAAPSP